MNVSLEEKISWRLVINFGLLLISICFVFIHFNSNSAQTQLTYLVWALPFFLILPIKKVVYLTEIKFCLLVLFVFMSSFITYSLTGDVFGQHFRSHWIYLFVLGTLAVFSQVKISKYYLLILLVLASLMVVYDVVLELFEGRARGGYAHGKPIFYGNIALTTGLVSLILSTNKNNSWVMRALLLLASIGGVVGSMWSQTRGGWIYLVLFSMCFFYFLVLGRKKNLCLNVFFTLLISLLIIYSFQDSIETRLDQTYTNIEDYFQHDNPNTSIGLRFELWHVSLQQFLDNPILGSARSGFLDKKEQLVDEGRVTSNALMFKHAHSDFFWTIGSKGLLGVLTLYGLYAFLVYFYYINTKDRRVRLYALSGLTVVSSYFIYGLSESFFSMKLGIGYFIILNLILIRLIGEFSEETPFYSNRG